MTHSPVQTTNTYEAVLQRLLDGIRSGEYPPASKLPSVRQLSIDWQVGQATVREALSALRAMNLIKSRQGEGTFVCELGPAQLATTLRQGTLMSSAEIRALLELRSIVESGTARLAARRRTSEDLTSLNRILTEMEADLAFADLGEEADWKLHVQLAEAAHNPYLPALMESVREQVQSSLLASRLALYRTPGEPERLLTQHRAIVTAVSNQDEEAAQQAILRHLSHVDGMLQPSPEKGE